METVKCEVCGEEMTAREASTHIKKTGHNSWALQPINEVDYRGAERYLAMWLRNKRMTIRDCKEWARWCYSDRPFWSVWGHVYGDKYDGFRGVQIYDDGEVIIIEY